MINLSFDPAQVVTVFAVGRVKITVQPPRYCRGALLIGMDDHERAEPVVAILTVAQAERVYAAIGHLISEAKRKGEGP